MELKEILAISGQSGLFKYVAKSANGVIVESLIDGKRMNATGSAKVSSMAEIAIYTENEDMPLWRVFEAMKEKFTLAKTISHKSEPAELKKCFASFLPDYDRERVHVSDMKKVIAWYNALIDAGMTDFRIEEEPQEEEAATDKSEE